MQLPKNCIATICQKIRFTEFSFYCRFTAPTRFWNIAEDLIAFSQVKYIYKPIIIHKISSIKAVKMKESTEYQLNRAVLRSDAGSQIWLQLISEVPENAVLAPVGSIGSWSCSTCRSSASPFLWEFSGRVDLNNGCASEQPDFTH